MNGDILTTGIKRGSDDLLSQSGAVSNGSVMSPQPNHAENNNDAKKVKLDKQNGKPSRVIHIRNIPNEVTEAEIIHLGIPFGRVTNVLVLKGKNQAFLEMADEVSATTMVTYFTNCLAQLRGRAVYVQFSNHKELKTDQTHSNAFQSAGWSMGVAAMGARGETAFMDGALYDDGAFDGPLKLRAAREILSAHRRRTSGGDPWFMDPGNASAQAALQAASALSGQSETQGGPNTVLRVIIEHMVYPVTLEVLCQIFTRFGKVLKIVTFTKNNTFQALIQYPDVVSAQAAKLSLDGHNIYNSCCTLRIEYSKLTSLNVKYNNDKSRDYTNPSLPTGDTGLDAAAGLAGLGGAPGVLASPFAAMHGLGSPLTSPYSNSAVGSLGAPGMQLAGFQVPGAAATTALGAAGIRLPATGCVLLVSNLNEEMVTPEALFTLFGVYGDVQRVKILYNKKDSALIQMAEPHQAHLAMTHMDKLKVFGKQIRVMPSKHQTVQLPKEGQPDAGLTKDFTNSPLHRFKKPGSKNYQNIYPPSATLHLSNIPPSISEEEIKEAFTKNDFHVKAFKFFPKDRKMALIQLSSMDDAVAALIKMHNYQLSESNHLRVSFSKSNI